MVVRFRGWSRQATRIIDNCMYEPRSCFAGNARAPLPRLPSGNMWDAPVLSWRRVQKAVPRSRRHNHIQSAHAASAVCLRALGAASNASCRLRHVWVWLRAAAGALIQAG